MEARQSRSEVGIPFIGHDDEGTGLSDSEVHTGDAGLRCEESASQVFASNRGQRVGVLEICGAVHFFVEELADFSTLEMDRGHDDVARGLVAELHDALAEIRIDDFNPALF
jgi:uncharacterized membrane protein